MSTFGGKQSAPISSSAGPAMAHTPSSFAAPSNAKATTSSSSSNETCTIEPSDTNAPMLPYTWMQLTASYARKHYPGMLPTWQANFVRYTLRMYGWKADDPVDLELHDVVYYTQVIFNKHALSQHRQIGQLIKPIDNVFKDIGMAPTQVIGPRDLDKAEQLADALNEVFDTLEAQRLASIEETKAMVIVAREEKVGQETSEPSAKASSIPVQNATSHAESCDDQQASPSSSDSSPSVPDHTPTAQGVAAAAAASTSTSTPATAVPISSQSSQIQAAVAGPAPAGFAFGGFNFTAADSNNANGAQNAAVSPTPVNFAFGASNSPSLNFVATQPQNAATGTGSNPFTFQATSANLGQNRQQSAHGRRPPATQQTRVVPPMSELQHCTIDQLLNSKIGNEFYGLPQLPDYEAKIIGSLRSTVTTRRLRAPRNGQTLSRGSSRRPTTQGASRMPRCFLPMFQSICEGCCEVSCVRCLFEKSSVDWGCSMRAHRCGIMRAASLRASARGMSLD